MKSLILICCIAASSFTFSSFAQSKFKRIHDVNKNQNTLVRVTIRGTGLLDTFRIAQFEYSLNRLSADKILTAFNEGNGNFLFKFNGLIEPTYISLFKNYTEMNLPEFFFEQYLLEPGDNIHISIYLDSLYYTKRYPSWSRYLDNYHLIFSGFGSPKFNCRYERDKAVDNDESLNEVVNTNGEFISNSRSEVCHSLSKKILQKYKASLSKRAYEVLKTDFFSTCELERIYWLKYSPVLFSKDISMSSKILFQYQNKITEEIESLTYSSQSISFRFSEFIVEKSFMEGKVRGNLWLQYLMLKKKYKGRLRDKILTSFAFKTFPLLEQRIIDSTFLTVKQSNYLNQLSDFIQANFKGKPAVNFSLPDTTARLVKLSDYKGKVVFIDFWFNGCGGCMQYYNKVVSKTEEHYKKNDDIVFITISVDSDKEKWLKGLYSGKYTSLDVINLYTAGKGVNHSMIKDYRISGYPRPLLIDRKGNIFSNSMDELRGGGAEKLIETIDRALAEK